MHMYLSTLLPAAFPVCVCSFVQVKLDSQSGLRNVLAAGCPRNWELGELLRPLQPTPLQVRFGGMYGRVSNSGRLALSPQKGGKSSGWIGCVVYAWHPSKETTTCHFVSVAWLEPSA